MHWSIGSVSASSLIQSMRYYWVFAWETASRHINETGHRKGLNSLFIIAKLCYNNHMSGQQADN